MQTARRSPGLREKRTGGRRDVNKIDDPCGLNAFPRAFESCKASWQVSWLRGYRTASPGEVIMVLITVARPRGILTRFPILPIFGAPRCFQRQRTIVNCPDGITRRRGCQILAPRASGSVSMILSDKPFVSRRCDDQLKFIGQQTDPLSTARWKST